MYRKIICIFMTVILMLTPISATAFEENIGFENSEGDNENGVLIEENESENAADGAVLKSVPNAVQTPQSGTCGESVNWKYTNGELIISGKGRMDDYNYFYIPWKDLRENINTVTVKNGVTYIGGYAFESCYNLNLITIPDSVTEIGYLAFHNCESLEEIIIPESVISIGNYAFDYCPSLKDICYPGSEKNWNKIDFGLGVDEFLSSVTVHYDIFSLYCEIIFSGIEHTSVEIRKGKNYSVPLNIFPVKKGCLTVLKVNGIEIEGNTFTVPESDTVTVEAVYRKLYDANDGGFCGVNAFWTITKGNELFIYGSGETDDYKKASATPWYKYCKNITKICISEGITKIGEYAFSGCSKFTEATVPESVKSIGAHAFQNCSSLAEILLPEGVDEIGNRAFQGCSSITKFKIPDALTEINNYTFSGCSNLENMVMPKQITAIGNGAFSSCSNLEKIVFMGNAPEVSENEDSFSSFDPDITIFYFVNKSGWSYPEWNGYNTEMLGNLNRDNMLNNKDVKMLFEYISKLISYDNLSVMDINFDGSINNRDVILLFDVVSQTL